MGRIRFGIELACDGATNEGVENPSVRRNRFDPSGEYPNSFFRYRSGSGANASGWGRGVGRSYPPNS